MSDLTDIVIDYEAIRQPTVSATDLNRAYGCLLAALPGRYLKIKGAHTLFKTRPQLAGIFFHNLVENARALKPLGKNEARKALRKNYFYLLSDFAQKYDSSLAGIKTPIQKWREVSDSLATVETIILRARLTDAVVDSEVTLRSDSTGFFGRIDELVTEGDSILIRDYKLRYRTEALNKTQFIDQLHFYSILVAEKEPALQQSLELVGLLGARLKVPFEKDRIEELTIRGKKWLSDLRAIGLNQTAASSICAGCDYCVARFSRV